MRNADEKKLATVAILHLAVMRLFKNDNSYKRNAGRNPMMKCYSLQRRKCFLLFIYSIILPCLLSDTKSKFN